MVLAGASELLAYGTAVVVEGRGLTLAVVGDSVLGGWSSPAGRT